MTKMDLDGARMQDRMALILLGPELPIFGYEALDRA
jgi:hypothetical protein